MINEKWKEKLVNVELKANEQDKLNYQRELLVTAHKVLSLKIYGLWVRN